MHPAAAGVDVHILSTGVRNKDSIRSLLHQSPITFFAGAQRAAQSDSFFLRLSSRFAFFAPGKQPMLDALKLAKAHPDREVVFLALGFETTMPGTALTVLQARRERISNFSLFCNHITIIPTIKAVLDSLRVF